MSADNGIYIEKKKLADHIDVYSVWEYSASVDYDEDHQMYFLGSFSTLEEAITFGQRQYTEYGISFGNLDA